MLDGPMRRRFADGLGECYPSYAALDLFLENDLGRALATITAPDALPLVIHRVLRAARAGGWLVELVDAAAADSPHAAVFREVQAAVRGPAAARPAGDLDVVVAGPPRLRPLADALRADPRVGRVACVPTPGAAGADLAAADALVVDTGTAGPDDVAGLHPPALPVVLVEAPAASASAGAPIASGLAASVTQIVVAGHPAATARRVVDHLAAVVAR